MIKVIIEIQDFEDKERVLNYFYDMCSVNQELSKFKVEIEGFPEIKRCKQ